MMSDQLFFSAILAIVALMVVVLAVLLGFLIGSRNTVRSERSSKVRHAKKSSPRKRKSVLKRFSLFLKRHWPKRKKRQEAPQVAQPAPALVPAPVVQVVPADQSEKENKGGEEKSVEGGSISAILFWTLIMGVFILPFLYGLPGGPSRADATWLFKLFWTGGVFISAFVVVGLVREI